jgi:hypothetical protein
LRYSYRLQEDPWLNARRGYTLHERSDVPIPVNEIRTYYAGLLWDGEAALSRHELLDDLPEPRVGSFYRAGVCIRGMKRHPFYSPAWAVALGAVIPPEPVLTKDMLAPIKRRDFVSARDL